MQPEMEPATPEEKKRKAETLIKLHEALDNFGETWQHSFTMEQCQQNIEITKAIGPALAKLYITLPVSTTFVLASILIEQIENAMSILAE